MEGRLRQDVNDALALLGKHLGFTDFKLEADGTIGFDFEDEISCTTEVPAGSDTIFLYAPVMRLPIDDGKAFLSRLLQLNLFALGFPGTWLALDEDEVLVCRTVAGRHFQVDEYPDMLLSMTEEVRSLRTLLLTENHGDDPFAADTGHFIRE